jgi:hypothetical protein
MAEKRPGQKLCYMGFMRFIAVRALLVNERCWPIRSVDTPCSQAFYKADSDQDAMTRLNSLGQARSSLVRARSVLFRVFSFAVALTV